MSTWLVDTHAVLWFLAGDDQLSQPARQTMESAKSTLLVSAASLWEIAIKSSLGKLEVPSDLPDILRREGFDELPVTTEHAWAVRNLAITAHQDPFDRLLVTQAAIERMPIISGDAALDLYGVTRHW